MTPQEIKTHLATLGKSVSIAKIKSAIKEVGGNSEMAIEALMSSDSDSALTVVGGESAIAPTTIDQVKLDQIKLTVKSNFDVTLEPKEAALIAAQMGRAVVSSHDQTMQILLAFSERFAQKYQIQSCEIDAIIASINEDNLDYSASVVFKINDMAKSIKYRQELLDTSLKQVFDSLEESLGL